MHAAEEERKSIDSVLGKFDSFLKSERTSFLNGLDSTVETNSTVNWQNSTSWNYTTLAKNCDFNELKEEMIRDWLVVGIKDSALSERLQLDLNLTLETAKKAIHQREAGNCNSKELDKECHQFWRNSKREAGSTRREM